MRRATLVLGSILLAGLCAWLVGRTTRLSAARSTGRVTVAADGPIAERSTRAARIEDEPATAAEAHASSPTTEREHLLVAQATPSGGTRVEGRLSGPRWIALDQTRLFWTVATNDGTSHQLDFPDASGAFLLDDVPPGHALELCIVPTGAPEQTHVLPPLAPDEVRRIELALDLGAVLEGVVQDELGQPRGDLTLALDDLRPSDLEWLESSELQNTLRTRTAADGTFRFGPLARGEWRLRLENAPRVPEPRLVDTRTADRHELTLLYPRVPERIVEIVGPDGKPRHAELSTKPPVEFQTRIGPGRFRLAGFDGPLELDVRGFPEATLVGHAAGILPDPTPLRIVLTEEPELPRTALENRITAFEPDTLFAFNEGLPSSPARPLCELAGRVLDERGRPLEGATIRDERHRAATTNARGEFLLQGLKEGTLKLSVCDRKSGALSQHEVELTPARRAILEVRMEPTRPVLVRGRLLGAGQERVWLDGERGRVELVLDDAGQFELEFPYPGPYTGSLEATDGVRRRLTLDVPLLRSTLDLADFPRIESP